MNLQTPSNMPSKPSIPLPRIGGEPPTSIKLFKWGENNTSYGSVYLNEETAALILDEFHKSGNAITFNIEHKDSDTGTPGYGLLSCDEQGLNLSDIRWSAPFRKQIQEGLWGYISPEILINPSTKEITAVRRVSLTNNPATKNAIPLLLSRTIMDELLLTKVRPMRELLRSLQGALTSCQSMADVGSLDLKDTLDQMVGDVSKYINSIKAKLEELGDFEVDQEDAKAPEENLVQNEASTEQPTNNPMVESAANEASVNLSAPSKSSELERLKQVCLLITKTNNIDDAIGSLTAMSHNAQALNLSIKETEKKEVEALVYKGIAEHKIPPGEKALFLSMNAKQINAHLERAVPLFLSASNENISSKIGKIISVEDANSGIPKHILDDAAEILSKV